MNNTLKPNEKRAQFTIVLMWTTMALNVLLTVHTLVEYYFYIPDIISEEMANILDILVGFLALGLIVAAIMCVIFYIMWFHRAYCNLHLKTSSFSYAKWWAIGGWFIPIMNFFVPYRIMQELYQKTNQLFSQNLTTCSLRLSTDYIGWWWGLWITFNIIARMSLRLAAKDVYSDVAILLEGVSSLILIPLTIVAVIVVKDYTKAEKSLSELAQNEEYEV